MASTGGGRPVTLAKSVRSHRRTVKMPRIDPRVVRSVENCSATCTIAELCLWLATYLLQLRRRIVDLDTE